MITSKSNNDTTVVIEAEDGLIPIIPLKDVVIFPNMVVPLFVGRQKSINALDVADKNDKLVILLSQKNPADNDVSVDNLHTTGTLAKILQILQLPDGTKKVLIEGKTRALKHLPMHIMHVTSREPELHTLREERGSMSRDRQINYPMKTDLDI